MPDYSPSPLTYEMGAPLCAVIRRVAVDNAGAVQTAGYWDGDRETWDAEYDPAKHVRPFRRLADDPAHHDYKAQVLAVPFKPFGDPGLILTVYLADDAGRPKETYRALGRNEAGTLCNTGN